MIAINLGGAVIPTVSRLIFVQYRAYGRGLLGVAIVSAIVHTFARPIPGVGIAIPIFIPPYCPRATGLLLHQNKRQHSLILPARLAVSSAADC